MMKINIVTIGTLKEKYLVDSVKEYLKRISRFYSINIIELEEEKLPKNYSDADISKCLVRESTKIEKYLQGYIVAMDIQGGQLTSEDFAKKMDSASLSHNVITFVIGSSYGLTEEIKSRAHLRLSFSRMTFPHQLFRVMLLEQIYRACTINNNIVYHK